MLAVYRIFLRSLLLFPLVDNRRRKDLGPTSKFRFLTDTSIPHNPKPDFEKHLVPGVHFVVATQCADAQPRGLPSHDTNSKCVCCSLNHYFYPSTSSTTSVPSRLLNLRDSGTLRSQRYCIVILLCSKQRRQHCDPVCHRHRVHKSRSEYPAG